MKWAIAHLPPPWLRRCLRLIPLTAPVTFSYHTLFVYEKKLGEKSNFRQSLIMGTLGNIYHIRKMKWCFSNNFTSYIEVYLRLDGEKRQLPSPVFN
ncbi:unnamed protein product [Rotaria magnacalcarata]|uniref:Uncharacterized protein n=2 Tax=Rotaria magnacalcarata TaxID=392030 RepID=A0A8S2JR11_9BILA|nr:unnamed protein product [Rotaria magnacalcarata]CAF3830663.1 unnamed protein product [Rotaria magnacalcarata]CAF3896193.1 unnamed protein product [Rotaria magnacalcarata]